MRKHNIISEIIVTTVMLIVAVVSLFYLPSEIAIQWNENGVSNTAGKFLILLFPALSVIFLILHNQKNSADNRKLDFVGLLVILIIFAAQSIIILNALEFINMTSLNYKFMQAIALLIIGLVICVCGNYMPKFAQNYYCGVKSSFAYSDNDIWTKTQRFAGKIWFVSGLTIMLLSFVQWKGVSALALFIILFLIIAPRIYCKIQYVKKAEIH